jgi:choline-sulfatase
VLGTTSPASVASPLYFMTDDDPSRGPNQDNWTGIGYNSVLQPNHLETVITRLADGKVWKYTRYFDNPQFWSEPGTVVVPSSAPTVEDVVFEQTESTPAAPRVPGEDVRQPIGYQVTVKSTPRPDQFEMYNVTDDPMELSNLWGNAAYAAQQAVLAQALVQQRCAKRLVPQSGAVPGEPVSC